MNKVYRIIWNSAQQCFTVASELAKGATNSPAVTPRRAVKPATITSRVAPLAFAVTCAVSGNAFAADGDAISTGSTTVEMNDPQVETTSRSVHASTNTTGGNLTINGGSLVTHGDYAHASYAHGGTLNLDGTTLSTTGTWSYGAYADGGGTMNIKNSQITTSYSKGYAVYASAGTINLDNTNVTTLYAGANAVTSGASGTLNMSGGHVVSAGNGLMAHTKGTLIADDVSVLVTQKTYSGLYASGAGASLNFSNGQIGFDTDGQFGATADGGALSLDTVSISGNNATGLNVINGGTLTGNHVTVNITDSNAVNNDGIHFSGNDTAINTLTLDNSTVSMQGNNALTINAQGGTNTATFNNSTLSSADGVVIYAENTPSLIVNTDNSTLSGPTLLQSGFAAKGGINQNVELHANNKSVLQGDIHIDPTETTASQVTLDNASVWSGASTGLHNLSLSNASKWNITGDADVGGLSVNDSTLRFTHDDTAFKTLTINGNYTANHATLVMSGNLGDDASNTDKLHITGDSAGKTAVIVNNIGGTGGQTLNGLQLIQVEGKSDGEFNQQGRIVAGAYDYQLIRGEGAQDKNWVLMSNIKLVDPPVVPPVTPVQPVKPPIDPVTPPVDVVTPPVDPVAPPVTPVAPPSAIDMVVRPEAGSYAANMAAANTLFSTSLQERSHSTNSVDPLTGEKKASSLWMVNQGGHNRSTDSSGQLKTQANRYVIQLGGDVLQWSSNDENRFHLGVMGGYANQHSNTHSNITGYQSKATTYGYSAGIYGTWFANEATQTGAYLDSWVRYNWFNNSVSSDSIGSESYRSKGLTASIEGGYTWQVSTLSERSALYLQPKAQLTWMNVKADDFNENNGTRVTGQGDGNVQSRLGVRAYIQGHSKTDDGKHRSVEPYVEANWVHNTENFGSALDGVTISQRGAENLAEVNVGVDAHVSDRINLWGNIGQQVGTQSYSDSRATLGVKVSF